MGTSAPRRISQLKAMRPDLDIQPLRGNIDTRIGKVTSENPEEQFQALEKYATDLTARAREGKSDPVIGRDQEIRRVHSLKGVWGAAAFLW